MSARDKRLEKAQMKVLFQVPFFAPAVAKLPVVWDKSVETACTAGQSIQFNPDFFDKLKDQEIVTVLCHEVAHCLLGHIWRAPIGCDWDRWNQATDHAVNGMLEEFAEQVKAKRLADPFPFPDGQWCKDPAFRGMAEEVIYNKIPQNPPGKRGKGGGGGKPSIGQIMPSKVQDPTAAKKVKADWDNTMIQCVQAAKGRGDIPGSVARYVDELVSPTVPWPELLRNWLREQAQDDWNWMKPNRYFDSADFILPSLDSERIGSVVFAVDTSGSIDQELLKKFKTEMQSCLDDLRPAKLVEICCDTRITVDREYQLGETIKPDAPGGGGTSFIPVFERIEASGDTPKAVVYLTDLDGAFPDKDPGYPVLWVAYGGGREAPFGEVVQAS